MRLALCRPDRVGDVILATACLEPIRRQLPDVRLCFLARETMRPLLEDHPLLDGFLALPPEDNHGANERLVRSLETWRPDVLVHLHPDPTAERAGQLADVPRRLGYRHRRPWHRARLTDAVPDRRALGCKHEAESNFDLLAPLGVRPPSSADELRPRVALTERWRESLREKVPATMTKENRPYVVFNPTAHALDLRWPAAHFTRLTCEIVERRPNLVVVLVAGRADDPSVVEVRTRLSGDATRSPSWLVDLAGRTNLGELAWLLRDARALVSRNTGTTHLAAAVGCPLVEVFGRQEPAYGPVRWRALGESSRTRIVVAQPSPRRFGEGRRVWWRRLHASVSPEEVRDALLAVLDEPTSPRSWS